MFGGLFPNPGQPILDGRLVYFKHKEASNLNRYQTQPGSGGMEASMQARMSPAVSRVFCCNYSCGEEMPGSSCGRCKACNYCCRACQVQAWALGHKVVCATRVAPLGLTLELCDSECERLDKWNEDSEYVRIVQETKGLMHVIDKCFATHLYTDKGIMACCHIAFASMKTGGVAHSIELQMLALSRTRQMGKGNMQSVVNDNAVAKMCCNLGHQYMLLKQYCKALHVFRQAETLVEHAPDKSTLIQVHIAMGRCMVFHEKHSAAIVLLEETAATLENVKTPADMSGAEVHRLVMALCRVAKCRSVLAGTGSALDEYQLDQAIISRKKLWTLLHVEPLACSIRFGYQAIVAMNIGVDYAVRALVCSPDRTENQTPDWETLLLSRNWCELSLSIARTHRASDFHIETDVLLHLAFILFDMGLQDLGKQHLREHLDSQLRIGLRYCRGCATPTVAGDGKMPKCSGCRVVRFCDREHQRAESGKLRYCYLTSDVLAASPVRHRDICPLLKKWRRVKEGRGADDSCATEHMEFLEGPSWYISRS